MKLFVFIAIGIAAAFADSVTLIHPSNLTQDLIKNPRYILFERDDGYIEVEDLYNSNDEAILEATEKDVTFYFFTPENPSQGVKIKESQLDHIVELTGFDIHRETLVVIHGWKNHGESPVNDLIKNAALQQKKINVIVADWSRIAKKTYTTAQKSVLAVGNYIGDFLIRVDDELNHKLDMVTIVGHSLGAHIAGNAGARTKGVIDTIVGLDPAGPLFKKSKTSNRLDPTDAAYVHVIHTNDGFLGFNIKMGHVDYYPNGGRSQDGCGVDLVGNCAHSRAYLYFSESLNNNKFTATKCNKWADYKKSKCDGNAVSHMGGFPIERSTQGDYFLRTNKKKPFARG